MSIKKAVHDLTSLSTAFPVCTIFSMLLVVEVTATSLFLLARDLVAFASCPENSATFSAVTVFLKENALLKAL